MTKLHEDITRGTRVGNYEVVSILGRGGMGAVYLARQIYLSSEAAIKVLLPRYCRDQESITRFFNEARAATAIRHPGIVQIFDFGYLREKYAYIVMELLHGESLDAHIRRAGKVPLEQALLITRQIAGALAAAHAVGIVHRDLKPDNMFLVSDPEVPGGHRIRILDFGIAKLVSSSSSVTRTRAGTVMGTPAYMAPEQCTGAGQIDARTGLYALGCILFRMLCGRVPFVRDGAGAVMAAHIYESPPRPGVLAGVPAQVEALILRLLAKAPEERFQDAASVIAAIDVASESLPGERAVGAGLEAALCPDAAPDAGSNLPPASPTAEVSRGSTLGRGASELAGRVSERASGIARLAALGVGIVVTVSAGLLWLVDEPVEQPRITENNGSGSADIGAGHPAAASASPTQTLTAVDAGVHAPVEQRPVVTQPVVVSVTIDATPEKVAVHRESDGLKLGLTPYRDTWPAFPGSRGYVLKKNGYVDRTLQVAGDRSDSYRVELAPAPGPRSRHEQGAAARPDRHGKRGAGPAHSERLPDVTKSRPLDPFEP